MTLVVWMKKFKLCVSMGVLEVEVMLGRGLCAYFSLCV